MKTQSRQILIVAFKRLLATNRFANSGDWQKVRIADSLSLYFPGGGPAISGFLATIHSSKPFESDGVNMHPDDVRLTATVGEYFDAIKKWYRTNGYTLNP